MSLDPKFGSIPRVGAALLPATLDTSLTAPTNVATVLTGVADGTQIEEVVCQGVLTTVAAVVNLFIFDATTYHLYDQILVPAITSSATALAWRETRRYSDLFLPNASHSLRAAVTVSGMQAGAKVIATGWDFT